MRQEESASPQRAAEAERTGTILSELRARVSSEEFAIIAPFAAVFLRDARAMDNTLAGPDAAALTLGACRFLCGRHTAPFALRIYRPNASEHGWQSPHMIVEVAARDQPGLVGAVCEVIEQSGATVEVLLSAVVSVDRDETGLARSIGPQGDSANEFILHAQIASVANPIDLENTLRRRLELLDRTRREAGPISDHVRRLIATLSNGGDEEREAAAFLAWLVAGRMNLAGYAECWADGTPTVAAGCYGDKGTNVPTGQLPGLFERGVSSAKLRSPDLAHGGDCLDEIRIRAPIAGSALYCRVAGGYTGQALRESTGGVPTARRICAETVAQLSEVDGGISAERLQRIFSSLPIDLVLSTQPTDLAEIVRVVHRADQTPGTRVCIAPCGAPADAMCAVTIVVSRGRMARPDIEPLIRIVGDQIGSILARHFVSDDLAVARLHLIADNAATSLRPDLVDSITERVRRALADPRESGIGQPNSAGPAMTQLAAAATPGGEPEERSRIEIEPVAERGDRLLIRATSSGEAGAMNELMAIIDKLGLRVAEHRSSSAANRTVAHEFVVATPTGGSFDPTLFAEMFAAVRDATVENDDLNSLSWRAGIDARSIEILRAYCALGESVGVRRELPRAALLRYPEFAGAFRRAFEIKFDPRLPTTGEAQRRRDLTTAREDLDARLAQIDDPEAGEPLSELFRLLDHTVRTSYYSGNRNQPGQPIAIKLHWPGRHGAPYQTFVYDIRFEGDHWRRGLIARGNLREAAGVASIRATVAAELTAADMRAGYISAGAGAAVYALRRQYLAQREAVLVDFIRSLLSVMDNVVQGEITRPPVAMAYDDPDPYFSLLVDERANGFVELASRTVREAGFWMGDAAVACYDHRVAAEGAAVRVRRLLATKGGGADGVTAVAIGAAHEAFLPPGVRLVAAVDGHEVFLDPCSDAARCEAGLARLTRLPRASWSDFPTDCRSSGSAVFNRDARKVELSVEARQLLGCDEPTIDGTEAVRRILASGVDLLWNRSSIVRAIAKSENAPTPRGALPVEVGNVGAATVVEAGADLFSPSARIEFALRGGDVYSAATDGLVADLIADRVSNVDLALHLAGEQLDAVEIPAAEIAAEVRGAAIAAMQEHIRAIVLDRRRAQRQWPAFASCMRIARETESAAAAHRPDAVEQHLRRGREGELTLPEIASLHATTLNRLKALVRDSSLAEDPYVRPWIDSYFPPSVALRFAPSVDEHPLRLEIGALAVSTRVVEVMGCSFVSDLAAIHGRSEIDVIKAWCAAFIFGGGQEVLSDIEASGVVPCSDNDQNHRLALSDSLRAATDRLLELHAIDLNLEKLVQRFGPAAGDLLRTWPEVLPVELRRTHDEAVEDGIRHGLSRLAADHVARVRNLSDIIDICDLAIQINSPRTSVALAFLGLDPVFHFTEIEGMIATAQRQDPQWGMRAAAHLRARLAAARRDLAADVVSGAAGRREPILRFVDTHEREIATIGRLIGEVRTLGGASIAAVEVLVAGLENSSRRPRRNW